MVQNTPQKEAFFPFLEEDLPDIVRGHEIWVEHGMQNVSPGNPVACDLCFGHNMKSDKAVQVEKVTPAVSGTWGKNHAVEVSAAENHLLMQFTPAFEGYHTIGVEYDGGILNLPHSGLEGPKYYQQYTKTIILVGYCQVGNCQTEENNQTDYDLMLGHELEIIPLGYRQYKVGEHILLKILYDRHALPDATVYGIYVGNQENPIEVTTDQEGMVDIELEKGGKWMFKVGHRDPEKGVKGLYDKKVMTATFTIMDVGENIWK
ncbi:hypothetical protein EO98_08545 [Methanosarcina sp. 2.H.T.1A.6]|uniref:DUF4198 domain-containing protein n=1 Tax=unclassified Methanosarcina TaxID=2644672 RepID=UPI000622A755|nr:MULTISPECIES: DUF4198 domain-containing protein [unclassified Methanosarcina]KKG15297.1 hypothetical protein EO94_10400 [Methanosarcina sp. 2.H.T.1A.3]KKG15479.1 hypothetical protein EO97_11860 [Methanosarcina sp. 2.H.T.1A.15]KKG20136.1 hypothetical protein EO98_08545 [Methanosarcina sp. 2.H.T.1A.6]KKG23554.1 hypothetical protein EO96_08605 [Methanosarcina sp. 2.H.T.1A.8]